MTKKSLLGKKLVIAAVVLILVLVGALAAGVIYLNRYLNTEGFRRRLEETARKQAGVELEVGDFSVSIFTGFTVRELAVGSPVPGDPPLFTAAEMVLKYNLRDLLSRKVTFNRIVIESPRVRLRKDSEGNWILPASPPGEDKPPAEPSPGAPAPSAPRASAGWEIAVETFEIRDGTVELATGDKFEPVRVESFNLSGRLLHGGPATEIAARLGIAGVDLGGDRLLEGLEADLNLKGMESLEADLQTAAAGGLLAGRLEADLGDRAAILYRGGLTLEGIEVSRLLKTFAPDAGLEATGGVFGRIDAEGEVDDPDSLQAEGKLQIREGTISGHPLQGLIASLLQDDEFRKISFDQTEAVFRVSGRLATLVRLIVHSRKTIFTLRGTVDLERGSEMDLEVGINFSDDLAGDIRPREVRDSFRPSADFPGYQVFPFRVWGTPDNLQNDFAGRLIQGGAVSILKKELLKKDRAGEEDPGLSGDERNRKREKREEKEAAIEEGVEKLFQLFGK